MPDLPSPFSSSQERLHEDRNTAVFAIWAGAVALLMAWLYWATQAQVSLYEVTSDARVELDGATYPITSPVLGQVVKADLRVGQTVHRGDVLIELDSTSQTLQLAQLQVQLHGLQAQLEPLHAQIQAERGAREREQASSELSQQEARDRIEKAQIPAQIAERDLARIRKLYGQQIVSLRDLDKAGGEAGRLNVELAELKVAASRIPEEQATRNRDREGRIARLEGELATVESQRDTLHAESTRLNYEIQRRQIQAAIDGKIGEIANLRVGAIVADGAHLGSIVPQGSLLVVAQYQAQAAFGRIHAGQRAALRLDGFPWTEFGSVSAVVERVAQEVRDGKVRVELVIVNGSTFRGVLEHGMPGTLEVGVERVTPWRLLLRTAGEWVTKPT
jgi:membrane fusion protein (multidrug efflux system)